MFSFPERGAAMGLDRNVALHLSDVAAFDDSVGFFEACGRVADLEFDRGLIEGLWAAETGDRSGMYRGQVTVEIPFRIWIGFEPVVIDSQQFECLVSGVDIIGG